MDPADALLDEESPELNGTELPPQRSRPGRLGGLFFQSSEESPSLAETLTAAQTEPGEHPAGGSPSGSESLPDEGEWSTGDPSSSPASSPDPASRKPLSTRALKPVFRNGVMIGSGMAHRFGARTEGQQQVGLFLADEEDAANIGDPLAAIAARREGIAGKVSPDTADAIQALMGLAGYMSKQMVRAQAAQGYDAQTSGPQPQTIPGAEQ